MPAWSLEPQPDTVQGLFNRDIPPILTIDSCDTVVYRTLEAGWSLAPRDPANLDTPAPTLEYAFPERRGNGHCLVGPVAIRGAQPGMTLEVAVEEVQVSTWGWTAAWYGPDAAEPQYIAWGLDARVGTGRDQFGHEITLRPFMGVMGLAPGAPGDHPTAPPRRTGGNLDCKELVAGCSLFLPIEVEGGLFSIGDGHAVQGDGEVCGTAIECPMDRVAVTFRLHPHLALKAPRARVRGAWITFGLDQDLNVAAAAAVSDMVTLIAERHGCSRAMAVGLASLAVDLRVTQIVNGTRGVHAILRDDAIRTAGESG